MDKQNDIHAVIFGVGLATFTILSVLALLFFIN